MNNSKKFRSISFTIVFTGLIFGLTIASLIKNDTSFSANENRILQQRPEFSAERLFDGTFTKEYETYVTDQFVARDQWIAMKVYAEKALQKKDINGVYFGKDHYLIQQNLASEIDQSLVDKNVGRIQTFIEQYKDKANINVMIVPTSSYILKDKMPKYANEYDQKGLMDQIQAAIGEDHYINVEDTLTAHKDEYVYYRTDHHWTSLGAFYAYQKAGEKMGFASYKEEDYTITKATDAFLGTTYSKVNIKSKADEINLYSLNGSLSYQVDINNGQKQMNGLFDMEKLDQKDKYPVFLGGNNSIVQITGGCNNGKTLLVIKDSFAHSMVPFLADHYEKIIMIDYRYYNMSTKKLIEESKVSDILLLYNTINFAQDKNMLKILK
ncbi:MAG: DHHW family protein [bacterium]|nr:DHHW family protein [bacterium]